MPKKCICGEEIELGNNYCPICGKKLYREPARGAGADSLERVVSWHPAKITTETGDELPAWVLKQGGRTLLTAVSQSEITEPVAASDRKLIAQAIADAS